TEPLMLRTISSALPWPELEPPQAATATRATERIKVWADVHRMSNSLANTCQEDTGVPRCCMRGCGFRSHGLQAAPRSSTLKQRHPPSVRIGVGYWTAGGAFGFAF